MVLLLTSFNTWLPHQKSNASDDLLQIIEEQNRNKCYYLRKLPVDTKIASQKAIAIIDRIQPTAIICSGMAESRTKLTIESNARCQNNCLIATIDLPQLISYLFDTYISHDAGQFVCEGLYYNVLNYLKLNHLKTPCIFVHVPVLTNENIKIIVSDFQKIINVLARY